MWGKRGGTFSISNKKTRFLAVPDILNIPLATNTHFEQFGLLDAVRPKSLLGGFQAGQASNHWALSTSKVHPSITNHTLLSPSLVNPISCMHIRLEMGLSEQTKALGKSQHEEVSTDNFQTVKEGMTEANTKTVENCI